MRTGVFEYRFNFLAINHRLTYYRHSKNLQGSRLSSFEQSHDVAAAFTWQDSGYTRFTLERLGRPSRKKFSNCQGRKKRQIERARVSDTRCRHLHSSLRHGARRAREQMPANTQGGLYPDDFKNIVRRLSRIFADRGNGT